MTINIEYYKGLIFDMDGTIIDSMPAHLDSWKETAAKFDFPYEREWIHSLGGVPSHRLVGKINKRHGLNLDTKTVVDFKVKTFANIEEKGDVIPCAFEIIKAHHGKKPMAVGTGSSRTMAIELLGKTGLLPFFESVVTASDVENHKPDPDTFLLAAKNLGLNADDCVVFEDTEIGKQAAHTAGMDCILVVNSAEFEFYPVK